MNRHAPLTRRRFLVLGGLSVAVLGTLGGIRLLGSGPEEPLTAHVGELLEADGLTAVGDAYLAAHPDEADEIALVRILEARREWRSVESASDVARAIAATSREDFRTGRIVNVLGWQLSASEARACALATFA